MILNLGINYKGIVSLFGSKNEEVINFTSVMFTIIVAPLYVYWFYWEGLDFSLPAFVNILLLSVWLLYVLFVRKIKLTIKKYVFLLILGYAKLYSIYFLGLYGGAHYYMMLIFGLLTFYYPKWFAISVNLIMAFCYFLCMFLYTNGSFIYYTDPALLAASKVLWLSDFILTFLMISVLGYTLYKIFIAYNKKVKEQVESHQKLQHTLENFPIPIGILKSDNAITYANKQFVAYFGFGPRETPTFNDWFAKVYPDEKCLRPNKEHIERIMAKAFKEQQVIPIEYSNAHTNDNQIKDFEVHHTIVGDTAICAFVDLTERKKQRRLIVETMMQAEKKENGRIAQELHDGIGPLLSTAKIYAHNISHDENYAKKQEYVERLNSLLDSSIAEVRNIINNIGPQILQEYGLVRAIESFIRHIQPVSSIHFKFDANGTELRSKLTEFAIYRTVLELINNSIKYASATEITIDMKQVEGAFKLRYQDNGIGFDYEQARTKGFGLENIKNRIENVAGTVKYTTSPGSGVRVNIVIKE